MMLDTVDEKKKGVHTRYLILLIIFIVTAVNYADRATLSIAGTEVAKELQLSAVSMGYIFSAFGWAYLLMQIPGGWLLDKFGSKKVYTYSLFFWSLFTFLQGFVDMFPLAWAGISMFFMRFMLGFSEAPSFPANARIVAAWFPTKERGTASAIFNSAQYFSLALFSPLLGWLTFAWGWEHVFTVMGVIGFVLTALWIKLIHNPTDHPRMSAEELKFISENGAVVDMDHKKPGSAAASGPKLHYIKQLLSNRMMLGVFFGQYFINTITWFFLTWFPIYLVQEKGMSILKVGLVASIPALCGFAGGVLGGVFSDYLIKRGLSLTLARKLPIVLGMLLASTIILCNYTNNTTLVVMLMALAFFGKGFGALGWPVISDTAPKEIVGLCGGVFNVFGNVASIVTPLVIVELDNNLSHYADVIKKALHVDVKDVPGAGAAGGMGAALMAFLGAELKSGIEIVTTALNLEEHIHDCTLVITGEGRIDSQSIHGKVPIGVANVAKKYHKPVIGIAGSLTNDVGVVHQHGIDAVFSVLTSIGTLDEAFRGAYDNICRASRNIAATLAIGMRNAG
ncbi:D-galactonate transporter [Escherichia coli]|nr:D-galactonate transporter [Escherichia coli]RIB98113.1 glycerate kinase [Escherichia coli]